LNDELDEWVADIGANWGGLGVLSPPNLAIAPQKT